MSSVLFVVLLHPETSMFVSLGLELHNTHECSLERLTSVSYIGPLGCYRLCVERRLVVDVVSLMVAAE